MSSVAITGNAAGAGVFTIASPNSASSFTSTLPAATTTLVGTDATQTLTNKTLTTPNIDSAQIATVSGTAPLYMARAWVNFNGTVATPSTIRGSGNVTSVTKNGTGDYTVNITTAMADANYAVVVSAAGSATNMIVGTMLDDTTARTTSAFRFNTGSSNGVVNNNTVTNAVAFR